MDNIVSLGEIIAGAFYIGFDRLDKRTIDLLVEEFKEEYKDYSYNNDFLKDWYKYLEYHDDKFYLRSDLKLSSYLEDEKMSVRRKLQELSGSTVSKFYSDLNTYKFLLKKIYKMGGSYPSEYESNIFSKYERVYLDTMYNELGYLNVMHDEFDYGELPTVFLSDYGKVVLFKSIYKEEIKIFKEEMKSRRIDDNLLDDYLLTRDLLEDGIWDILNVDYLKEYCNKYDRAFLEEGAREVYFNKLDLSKNSDGSGKKALTNLFTIFDDGHTIYVCHPNHIFHNIITPDIEDITNINWDDIDMNKMFEKNDYKEFFMPDEAFRYTAKRLEHMIKSKTKINREGLGHLAVIEKYLFDYSDYYLVRGIIKGDKEALYIAFNPEYENVIPKNIFEKNLRFVGREIPKVYLKERKGIKK